MKAVPTPSAFWRTVWWTLFAAFLLVSVVALWGWHIANAKLSEILETAEFNDLDGDGHSVVEIRYK